MQHVIEGGRSGKVVLNHADSESYLFALYWYIEMNPVKAKMVKDIADYPWSSYRHNGLGEKNSLITEHRLYQELGNSREIRAEKYQKIFSTKNTTKQEQERTAATMRGEVYGSGMFHHKIGKLISRATKLSMHGVDRKSENYRNQVG